MLLTPALLSAAPSIHNLAPAGIVTASSSGFGSAPGDLNDGNHFGQFASGSVWHTLSPDTAAFVEVDLGSMVFIDRISTWPRTDVLQNTLTDFRLTVFDATNGMVWTQDFLPDNAASTPWGSVAMRGVVGQRVRLERLSGTPTIFTFAELAVYGSFIPIPQNLALNKPTLTSGDRFDTPAANGNDGDISGNYTFPGNPIWHSTAPALGNFWEVDLEQDEEIDYLLIHNRVDASTTPEVRLTIRDAASNTVYNTLLNINRDTVLDGGAQYHIPHDMPGLVTGRYVRIETVAVTHLAFAELELFGEPTDDTPPTVFSYYPGTGTTVRALYSSEVFFSEPVIGLEASDLLVNGSPATTLTPINANGYIFTFPAITNGPAIFSWMADPGITDAFDNPLVQTNWTVQVDSALPDPDIRISEFLASNGGGLEDEDGDSPDWIELTLTGPAPQNLSGWFLTDDPDQLTKWRFPQTDIRTQSPMIVFASSKDRKRSGHPLHTNFKIDADGGYLALVHPDGTTIADAWTYDSQTLNVSIGMARVFDSTPLLSSETSTRYLLPTNEVPGWQLPGFDDATWQSGTASLGYYIPGQPGGFGPVGYWNFDQTNDLATALDQSGYDIDGSILNATYTGDTGGASGLAGDTALSFAGNGVVQFPDAANGVFDRMAERDAITLSLWTYGAPSMPANNNIFFARPVDGSTPRGLGAHLPWGDSTIYFDTANCCDPILHRLQVLESDPTKWRGAWNHYAFVKDGSRKEIWQNGTLLANTINTEPLGLFREFFLGAVTAAGTQGYQGEIDDFALFADALPAAAIAAMATPGNSPLDAPNVVLTPIARTDLSAMHATHPGVFLRIPFTITYPSQHPLLRLALQSSDGFVAYLNGTEIARRNIAAGPPTAQQHATNFLALSDALSPQTIDFLTEDLLLTGSNVLAIHGLNADVADGSFHLAATLSSGSDERGRLMVPPTPGEQNGEGFIGFVADTKFNPDRGFYDAPVAVTITSATTNAVIIYTTDGSVPSLSNGIAGTPPVTVTITNTTPLRARAIDPTGELAPTDVDTHTYLYLDQVAGQQAPPTAPASWPGGFPADFTMDERVVTNALPNHDLSRALESIPSLMVTTPPRDLWSTTGIYYNATSRGSDWERSASGEWLDPTGAPGFAEPFGLRIHGNISRNKDFTPKHGFKMYFRSRYGTKNLSFPLFPDSSVDEFKILVLRAGSTDTFPVKESGSPRLGINNELYPRWLRERSSYIRDQWARDTHRDLGRPASHGRYIHLYLNGTYWGVYNICELPGVENAARHFGGDAEDYDAVADNSQLKDGDLNAWNQLMNLSGQGFSNDSAVQQLQGNHPDGTPNPAYPVLLDVDALIDYFILHIFIGADDWPSHNWWAVRHSRGTDREPWHFFTWDQEISNQSLLHQRISGGAILYAEVGHANTVAQPYAALRQNAEFRMRFADRVHQHLFNQGALSYSANTHRWGARKTEIDQAIVAESARWGDYQRPAQPYTRESDWLPHLDWMATNFWPQINGVALERYRAADLYPDMHAPEASPFGASYGPGFSFSLSHANLNGAIYYTLDGSDPRLPGGALNPNAIAYNGIPITLSLAAGGADVNARVFDTANQNWSALSAPRFTPHPDFDGDGIDTTWEQQYNLDPEDPSDAESDDDQDGRSALDEFIADTDPGDPASTFEIVTPTRRPDGSMHLIWTSSPNRTYDILGSTAPGHPWIALQTNISGAPASFTTSEGVQPAPDIKIFVVRVRR